ncbi:MAG: hypothetical protein COZ06_04095 [Armatimonadetes bacterium CG_4_10_14_3_um_filter_66_18]|nr:Gfo/Idh/MocA family oxidoreductase [Armatimonadota bacterium]OIO94560.1 MAG: hypothetical protein AUJ96_28555 [Armatimonadetes bacterium CG2_30_66_41]PIU92255.1 MAG: hypothetical protein COS65_18905 [Armatimonadetes bacterium CG06_land_8_20_14_3_00_66_21]PIX40582.1 MAG: hypothetical protein COZ57_25520 [Armatimonadetes bacterium CG_4_8_14_3_um_filter_66_20]PIY51766.1 MAG: hypothetical protein COZ06_04095 [Armatimonadetes bacterium CG_4_10_14_3_um_filter_66_18]PIZ40651.1 MAG: hypothetical pr
MADKVRICCIGCGGMASSQHYPSLAEMQDVELVALSELDEAKMQAGVEKFGFPKTYADYREMVETEKPDAVYALMPPMHIFPVLEYLLSHGHNTFTEKPPALTLYQGRVLVDLIEKNGNITMVGYQRKWVPLVRKMRELVEERGPLDQFTVGFHKNGAAGLYYGGAIDVLTCDASHMVDCLLWLGGSDPVDVVSAVRNSTTDSNCKYNALVAFEDDRTGFFSANWNSGTRYLELEIHGNGCVARSDVENTGTYYDRDHPAGITLTAQEAAGSDVGYRAMGFFDQSRHFIDCVKSGEQPVGSYPSAYKTMELVEAFYANSMI